MATIPAVAGLPVVGNLLDFRKDRLALQDRAQRTGPIARLLLGHIPIYTVSDADLAHQVFVAQADAFEKSAGLQMMEPLLGRGLLTSEHDVHKRHRKLLAPAFAPKRLAAYCDVMVGETLAQIATWSPGDRIDLSEEMMEMTLAIAGKTLFSADVRGDAYTVAIALELAMKAQVANITSPVRLGYKWPLPRHRKMRKAVAMLDEVVYRMIADGRRLGTDRGDVLSMLLLARDEDGNGFTDKQVRDEVMTLLLAGHETTANTLAWTWYELGRNSGVLARCEAELADVLGDRTVTVEDLARMPWNLAVIEEAMRLHPPAYMTGRQAIRDVELGGHHIPSGSTLLIYIRGIHRRADYWPSPLVFDPERMLPEAKKARPRHHYLPFGAGPRVCIGSHFALLEAQLCLATMIQRTKLRPLATHVEAEPLVTLRPRGGLPTLVERC
ncbi:MAG TPA: cytochrome P450 [Kofleriaceae bacterium]|nr:cytochrome P450 [Kofleriaceae bacterium]